MSIVVGRERRVRRPGDPLELVVVQDRVVEHELARRARGPRRAGCRRRADPRLEAHHDRLADRVDRRVGDLGEALLEVGEQRRLALGERREREVVAHRAGRLDPGLGRGRDQHPQVLLRVAEGELAGAQRLVGAHRASRSARSSRTIVALLAPARRRACARATSSSASPSASSTAALEVDDEQAARVQAAAARRPSPGRPAAPRPRSRATTSPSSVTSQRPGRRPLRSRQAPTMRPSENAIAAGPSQGSITEALVAVEAVELGRRCRRGPRARRGSSSSSPAAAVRPASTSSSSTRSKAAESELPSGISGRQRSRSGPNRVELQRRLAGPHPVDVAGEGVDLAVVGE